MQASPADPSRRAFLATSAGLAALGSLGVLPSELARGAWAGGSEEFRIGLIGCGGRGTGAAVNALQADPAVRIVALADLLPDRLASSRGYLSSHEAFGPRAQIADDMTFVGFDAYKELLARADIDSVILATPPHFRPIHAEASINAGRHVFMEKPVAVDPVGARRIIASGRVAADKGLAMVAGTQRRHEASYIEALTRVGDGQIGEPISARCYWNQGGLWVHDRAPEESDMEWQVRNWLYFCWLSGDHICEQHIHNLDVINWAAGESPPASCIGMGGRQVRTDAKFGNIFDHFAINYAYPSGLTCTSMCRQTPGAASRVEEVIQGTHGTLTTRPGFARIEGDTPWEWSGRGVNPYVQEHADMLASIRVGSPLNEAHRVAQSTLTAIMGRMSAYTGQELTWDRVMDSKLDLSPAAYAFGPLAVRPVPTPGSTPVI